jgi:hypothetical protein
MDRLFPDRNIGPIGLVVNRLTWEAISRFATVADTGEIRR